jgi:hypothetical protein
LRTKKCNTWREKSSKVNNKYWREEGKIKGRGGERREEGGERESRYS